MDLLWLALFIGYSLVALPVGLTALLRYMDLPVGHARRWRESLIVLALHGPLVGFERRDWRFGAAATVGVVALWAAAYAYDSWEKRRR